VAVGDTGTVVTGLDGENWVLHPVPTVNTLLAVTTNGTTIVAVGAAGTILTSEDSITWVLRDSNTTRILRRVVWIENQFVVVGGEDDPGNPTPPVILTSPDGIEWTSRLAGGFGGLYDITWDGGQMIAVGTYDSGAKMLKSFDGISWEEINVPVGNLFSISWQEGLFAAVGTGGLIVTSQDGTNWTEQNSSTDASLLSISSSTNQFVAVGEKGTILSSVDGIQWLKEESGIDDLIITESNPFSLNEIAWGIPRFVIVGDRGAILRTITPTDLNQALDNTEFSFVSSGDAGWFGQIFVGRFAGNAAQSRDLDDDQTAILQTGFTGPGKLSFYWKVSSEQDFDTLYFFIDGVQKAAISGEVDWHKMTFDVGHIGPGFHVLSWVYRKDHVVSEGFDAGWVDQVMFTPTILSPTATTQEATSITSDSATLNATVNPKGDPTSVVFEYGGTTNFGFSKPGTNAGSGIENVSSVSTITGLTPETTYHFRVKAINNGGESVGENITFTTLALQPAIEVISPNGGETLKAGTMQEISWFSEHVENVKIEYSLDDGANWTIIAASTPASAGSISWTLPDSTSRNYSIRISGVASQDVNDTSDDVFTVFPAQIGDVNGDGIVSLNDLVIVLQVLSDIPPSEPVFPEVDANGDGVLGIEDVIFLMQHISGSRP